MTVVVAVLWLVTMLAVLGGLLWWDHCDRHEQPPPTFAEIVDRAAARALDGDEASEDFLWDLLIDHLTCYRNRRLAMEHAPERAAPDGHLLAAALCRASDPEDARFGGDVDGFAFVAALPQTEPQSEPLCEPGFQSGVARPQPLQITGSPGSWGCGGREDVLSGISQCVEANEQRPYSAAGTRRRAVGWRHRLDAVVQLGDGRGR